MAQNARVYHRPGGLAQEYDPNNQEAEAGVGAGAEAGRYCEFLAILNSIMNSVHT